MPIPHYATSRATRSLATAEEFAICRGVLCYGEHWPRYCTSFILIINILRLGTHAFYTVFSKKPDVYGASILLKSLQFELSLRRNKLLMYQLKKVVKEGLKGVTALDFWNSEHAGGGCIICIISTHLWFPYSLHRPGWVRCHAAPVRASNVHAYFRYPLNMTRSTRLSTSTIFTSCPIWAVHTWFIALPHGCCNSVTTIARCHPRWWPCSLHSTAASRLNQLKCWVLVPTSNTRPRCNPAAQSRPLPSTRSHSE